MWTEQPFVWICRAVACLLCAGVFFAATKQLVGVMQQCGYKNKRFAKWLGSEQNTYGARLLAWSVLSVSATALFIFVFFFLQETPALLLGGIPFFGLGVLFMVMDRKFALKVPAVKSERWKRLAVAYCVGIALSALVLISLSALLDPLLQMLFGWLRAMRFLPMCFLPILLPYILMGANAVMSGFENKRNERFVKAAGRALGESKSIKVGIVGSYGKTSVKNALKTILSERFVTVATPASYNTPMGVAKTVLAPEFSSAEVFLCEMGARYAGDIRELCELVKPDYVVFTGVCAQHVESFGSEEGVFFAKSEALHSGAKLSVCGGGLEERIRAHFPESIERCKFVGAVKDLALSATKTVFTLPLSCGDVAVETALLGECAAENVLIAATLAEELGLSKEEIASGVAKLVPVEHRLQLLEKNGVYFLDDAYNCNLRGAKIALAALQRFGGKKYLVTPGIVETGTMDSEINGELGKMIAQAGLDGVFLVGETQVKTVLEGYKAAGGDMAAATVSPCLSAAVTKLSERLQAGDCVLFMNDLPDVF